MSSQLVAFSGFSATNYIQEPYSADLDFGTGEFSVGAWLSSTGYGPSNLCTQSDGAIGSYAQGNVVAAAAPISGFTNSQSVQLSANGAYCYKSLATTLGLPHCLSVYVQMDDNGIPNPSTVDAAGYDFTMVMFGQAGFTPTVTAIGGGVYRVSVTGVAVAGSNFGVVKYGDQTSRGFKVTGYQIELGSFPKTYRGTTAAAFNGVAPIAERAAASGSNITVGLDGLGKLVATAFDGTTTRTVTTPATYNTGIFTKATANYTAAGKLSINVNGVEVAAVTGAPLLSLSSRYNLLIKTENFADAVWVKVGNTVVTTDGTLTPSGALATKLTAGAANSSVYQSFQSVAGSTYCAYFDVKAGNVSVFDIDVVNQGVVQATVRFDLNAVTAVAQAGAPIPAIVGLGAGFYRCSLTKLFTAANYNDVVELVIGPIAATVAGKYLYVAGAQLETGLAATRYQRVNTATDIDYAATLTIGNSRTLDAPFPGSITMLKLGATVPTPEQAVWMYEQEKPMFRPGAQVTLPEASPVLDLGYDESQDKWVAVQAGHESSFTGLIRTATATPSVGNFTKVVAGSGVKALARTSTDPGVDIQIPAYGLREELVKRAEAAAKASKTLTVFDFDSVVGQTDFVLPMGWKAASVVSAGNTQREGATKNFIRLFDGFRETICFAVAPGAAVWIRINAIKE